MRRFLAYIILAISVLLCVGVAATPVITRLNSDIEYQPGQTATFRLTDAEDELNPVADDSSKKIADEMSSRLSAWGVSNYSVVAEGSDTVEVTYSAGEDEYDDINKYLSFSGQNYSIATEDDKINFVGDEMFKGSVARIEYVNYAPVVVIPVSDGAKLKEQVDGYSSTGTKSSIKRADSEDSGFSLYLWTNRKEGESYEDANDNPDIAEKVLVTLNSANLFYANSSVENTEIEIVLGATDSEGKYDTTKVAQANYEANCILRLFNASKLDFKVTCLYSAVTTAEVENLLSYGLTISVANSKTLIASLILYVMVVLILALFYRLGSIGPIATSTSSVFLTLVFFVLFTAEFNIAALVGILIVAGLGLFSGILYNTKLREELYKGRSLKKANAEASKRSIMPIIDVSLGSIIIGVVIYLMGGSLVSPLGIMLVVGGVLNLLFNTLGLRLMMWLITNSTNMQGNHKAFNVEDKMVPSLIKDEKPSYEGIYQNKDFTKRAPVVGMIAGVFSIASIVMMIVFGITSGTIYNTSSGSSSKIYFEITDKTSEIADVNIVENSILGNIYIGDAKLEYDSVASEEHKFYNADTADYDTTKYYVVTLSKVYSDADVNTYYTYEGQTSDLANLQDTLTTFVETEFDSEATISLKADTPVVLKTISVNVLWAVLIGLAISAVYYMFRYRIARGLAMFVVSALSGLITLGLFAVTRIACTPVVTLAGVAVALFAIMLSTYYLAKEREYFKENKGAELSKENRHNIMVKGVAIGAGPMVVFTLCLAYLGINYFGFGPSEFALMFGGLILGTCLSAFLIIALTGPIAEFFAKLFSHIKIKKLPRSQKAKEKAARRAKTAEPEEAIFIGIND
ncbi:MAG: hypothetical protein WC366_04725 [Bacilli bacterium]|jgi:preprotein translocase subunit SecF